MTDHSEYQTVQLPVANISSLVHPGAARMERQMIFGLLKGLKWSKEPDVTENGTSVYVAKCPKNMSDGDRSAIIPVGEYLAIAGFVNDDENSATVTHESDESTQCRIRVSGSKNVVSLLAVNADFPGKEDIIAVNNPNKIKSFLNRVDPLGASYRDAMAQQPPTNQR